MHLLLDLIEFIAACTLFILVGVFCSWILAFLVIVAIELVKTLRR